MAGIEVKAVGEQRVPSPTVIRSSCIPVMSNFKCASLPIGPIFRRIERQNHGRNVNCALIFHQLPITHDVPWND